MEIGKEIMSPFVATFYGAKIPIIPFYSWFTGKCIRLHYFGSKTCHMYVSETLFRETVQHRNADLNLKALCHDVSNFYYKSDGQTMTYKIDILYYTQGR